MKTQEKYVTGWNGYLMFIVLLAVIVSSILLDIYSKNETVIVWSTITGLLLTIFIAAGFAIINPNKALVLTLFGKYNGTIVHNGFFWVLPFNVKQKVSLRARNLNSAPIKVNDKMGNPIMIGIVLVWRIKDTFKAVFEVSDYLTFVDTQSEAAVRNLAGAYPYDNLEDENANITLRGGGEEVNTVLEKALSERLFIAGVEVIEARISNLAYAPEIAGAMLQRQQATAIVSARQKIVEGAVTMVEMALDQLSDRKIVELDPERKAAMVSNLMVVLTSDRSVNPVINTGSLYQ